MAIDFFKLDPKKLSEEKWNEYFDFRDRYFQRLFPGDPQISYEQLRQGIEQADVHFERSYYLFEQDGKIVGDAYTSRDLPVSPTYEQNKHLMYAELRFDEELSEEGLTRFFEDVVSEVKKVELVTTINISVFLEPLKKIVLNAGASLALKFGCNRLYLNEVDWNNLECWIADGEKLNPGLKLEFFEELPPDLVENYCKALTTALGDMPQDDMEHSFEFTPAVWTEKMDIMKASGKKYVACIAFNDNSEIAAFTDVTYNEKREQDIGQGMTFVLDRYRGSRIGRWIKAKMLNHIKKQYPKAEFITTSNANSNRYMIAINQELGFKSLISGGSYTLKL